MKCGCGKTQPGPAHATGLCVGCREKAGMKVRRSAKTIQVVHRNPFVTALSYISRLYEMAIARRDLEKLTPPKPTPISPVVDPFDANQGAAP